jgi:hypothetical protein
VLPNARPGTVTFQPGSAISRRMAAAVESLRFTSPSKQELRVVWADEAPTPETLRFGVRLVEDSVYGVLSYVDWLCKLHSKIQSK